MGKYKIGKDGQIENWKRRTNWKLEKTDKLKIGKDGQIKNWKRRTNWKLEKTDKLKIGKDGQIKNLRNLIPIKRGVHLRAGDRLIW